MASPTTKLLSTSSRILPRLHFFNRRIRVRVWQIGVAASLCLAIVCAMGWSLWAMSADIEDHDQRIEALEAQLLPH
jgi:hypothetical protein